MIDSVYSSVLSILNKSQFGYLSPADFNKYAKLAQLEIYQNYFGDYNKIINLENVRRSGTELADRAKKLSENIETFSVTNYLSNYSDNLFYLPSLVTTGDVAYMMGKVLINPTALYTGTVNVIVANALYSSNTFQPGVVYPNDLVVNTTTGQTARVVDVQSVDQINLTADIFQNFGEGWAVFSVRNVQYKEAEKISHAKSTLLNTSLLTTPNTIFPAYTQEGNLLTIFPTTIDTMGMVLAQYYKYPADPKWSYITLSGGSPVFDQSQSDYQDFEIPEDEFNELVIKICKLAGVEIREAEVVNFANNEEAKEDQPKI